MFNTKNQELENKTWTMADFLSNGEDIDVEPATKTGELEDTAEEKVSEEEQKQKAEEDKEEGNSKPEQQEGPPAQELGEEEERANPSQNPTVYAELLNAYIEEGDWEDAIVEIEGEEVQLSELKSVDKETFLQIKAAQKRPNKKSLKKNTLILKG